MTATATLGSVDSIATHFGPWTERDYLALPELDGQRAELIDGELIMSPAGDGGHQNLVFRLRREFGRLLPAGIVAMHEANVRLRTGRLMIPDLVVTVDQTEPLIFAAADVRLLAEVVSPFGQHRDRVTKPSLYAEAGIPWYLLVERDPKLELTLFRRRRTTYAKHTIAGEGDLLDLPDLGCSIEVDALLHG